MSQPLNDIINALSAEYALTPVMAAEIECYVPMADTSSAGLDAFWVPVNETFKAENLSILRIEKERGEHQYEIITQVTTAENLVHSLRRIRAIIEAHSAEYGLPTSFAAKPFADQPSSGLHIHLHLADGDGMNAYHKPEEWTSEALRFSLGGLLATLPESMPVFFPNAEDYARLDDADHVPKIASWGVNNRYCALRIPMNPDPYDKRIEHRVPCANAEPEAVVVAILHGVLKGLREGIEPPAQEYGKPTVGLLESFNPLPSGEGGAHAVGG